MKKQRSPVAAAVQKARERAGISQRDLADMAQMSRSTIAAIEGSNYTGVNLRSLERIAQVLNCSPIELIGETRSDAELKALSDFLKSPLAAAIRVSQKEAEWLGRQRITWGDNRLPEPYAYVLLVEALRHTLDPK